jgi:hypothetical protein
MANLITKTEYKTRQGIASASQDGKIDALIPAVSQLVKTYCGNSIVDHYSTNKIETFTINWSTNLVQLTESPFVSVVSIFEREDFSKSYVEVPSTEYYIDGSTDSVYRVTTTGTKKAWPTGPASVKVTYKAGYDACPEDLQLAVVDLITYYLKDEHKARQTIAGASLQNNASTSQRNNVTFPDHIKRILDLYKTY